MISVVELQGVSQGNSDSGSERLRLPTASLTIVFYRSLKENSTKKRQIRVIIVLDLLCVNVFC